MNTKTTNLISKKIALIFISIIVLSSIIIGILVYNKLHSNSKTAATIIPLTKSQKTPVANGPAGAPDTPKSSSTQDNVNQPVSSSAKAPVSTTSGSGSLISPYGSFVSNHKPYTTSSEQSACNTSPGAQCYITFSKDNLVKSLPVETTNQQGLASWSWNVGQSGITAGTWVITVYASQNNNQKTVIDTIPLEVQL
ncbi:MAG: hypothetical protein NVSMB46_05390 [Candidatus Saccharimonadales bacterium]